MSEARNAVASATGPLFEMGVRAERQRIIALLDSHLNSGARWHVAYQSGVGDAIALIKGEDE